ncbi:MAG: hypothetical protein NZM12_06755, partial [Steroidobacteraceae bacterium]|nr:hypothetical protein [Steroidobacteraceae bacterium]
SAAILLACWAALVAPWAEAASTPSPELLQELRQRLLRPPDCVPDCATVMSAIVAIDAARMTVELEIAALATVALPIPVAADHWALESVTVDGAASIALLREADSSIWLPLRTGARRVRLAGVVAPVDNLQLAFPSPPRAIRVTANGWDVAGVAEGRLLSGALDLTRRRSARAPADGFERGNEFPAFVRVVRDFNLDLDWSVSTTVERVAPPRAAIAVDVALMPGESVLTSGVKLRDPRTVIAAIAAGETATRWSSSLAQGAQLELTSAAAEQRIEVWRFVVNPQWRAEFAGMPAVLPDDLSAPDWVYTYYPRPGERLSVRVTRPPAAPGATLAIDRLEQRVTLGARSRDAQLQLRYRSTQGGRHVIRLPGDAAVQSVLVDGNPVQLRPERGALSLPILPGEHSVNIAWRAPRGAGLSSRTEAIDIGAEASNVTMRMQLPADRWPLVGFSRGAGVGPAVLYWGELIVFLATAWLLGRWPRSPLKFHEWLLLGLGLSTLSWAVFVVVALWLLALRWRADWRGDVPRWQFNGVQIALAVATLIAVSSLIFSGIRYGFFAAPDMGVVGPGSDANAFEWFRDRVSGPLPEPLVISAPMWLYKALILAWALWVAAALVRWLKWGWQCWSAGDYWRSKAGIVRAAAAEPDSAA